LLLLYRRKDEVAREAQDIVGPRPSNKSGSDAYELVVDDYRDTADTMATILRLYGHAVTTANDGESAMEALQVLWPDAVLLDLGLPGISGNEVARRIRAMTGSRHQPVIIALTGHMGEEGQCKTDGFDHCLVKPVDPERFVGLIANLTVPSLNH
jgi:two-component system, chemotaxis family, CheB/CheR fusion protein